MINENDKPYIPKYDHINNLEGDLTSSTTLLKYEFYINRDKQKSINLFEQIFSNYLKNLPNEKKQLNKHKCNRDDSCKCIELGKILIDIHMLQSSEGYSESAKTAKEDLRKVMEKYFFNYNLYLPFELFIYLIKNLLKQFNYQDTQLLIETYLTYSQIKLSSEEKRTQFEIELEKYEELQKILIFEIFLNLNGFVKTNAKILQIKIESIKENFMKIFHSKIKEYVHLSEKEGQKFSDLLEFCDETKSFKSSGELGSKLKEIIEKSAEKNMILNDRNLSYKNFEVKNSLLSKLCKVLLNKRILISVLLIIFVKYFIKIIKSNSIDKRLVIMMKIVYDFLKKYRIFIAVESFSKGIIKLLIDY